MVVICYLVRVLGYHRFKDGRIVVVARVVVASVVAAVVVVPHSVMDTALRLSLFMAQSDKKRRKELAAMGSW